MVSQSASQSTVLANVAASRWTHPGEAKHLELAKVNFTADCIPALQGTRPAPLFPSGFLRPC